MAIGTGAKSLAGVGVESVAGTPVAATQKIPFINENLVPRYNEILNPALLGNAGHAFSDQGSLIIEGGFTSMFNYQLDDIVFAHFFGAQTQGTGNDATYDLQAALDDWLTLAIEKTVSVWEYTGFKGSQLVITGTPTDGIRYTLNGIAIGYAQNVPTDTSAMNISSVLSALSAPPKNGLFQHVSFKIEELGTALSEIRISGFTLTIDRHLDAPEADQQNRLEALENDFRDVTLQIVLPRYSDDSGYLGDQFHDWHSSDTKLYATLGWTDGTSEKTFRLNKMKVTNPDGANVNGAGALTQTIEFRCFTDLENDNTDGDFDFTTEVELYENG